MKTAIACPDPDDDKTPPPDEVAFIYKENRALLRLLLEFIDKVLPFGWVSSCEIGAMALDDVMSERVIQSRDDAVVAAFDRIASICRDGSPSEETLFAIDATRCGRS